MYLLELKVPETYIRLQDYYDWCDVIYYTEYPDEWSDAMSLQEFKQNVFHYYQKHIPDPKNTRPTQATIPFIKPRWLVNKAPLPDKYSQIHNGHGSGITRDLKYYIRK